MKKFLFICSCLFAIITSAQQVNEPFNFPIKPGSKEWPNFKTDDERFKATQIPDSILSNMSTYALVVSCINYPSYIVYITAFDIQTGYSILASNFNGLDECMKRPDAAISLIGIYKIAGEKGFLDQLPYLDERNWTFKISWMEIILSQDNLIKTLDNEERKELLSLANEKFKMKVSSNDYSGYDILTAVFLIGKVLHSLNYNDFESEISRNSSLRNFLINPQFAEEQTINKIFELSKKYLENQ